MPEKADEVLIQPFLEGASSLRQVLGDAIRNEQTSVVELTGGRFLDPAERTDIQTHHDYLQKLQTPAGRRELRLRQSLDSAHAAVVLAASGARNALQDLVGHNPDPKKKILRAVARLNTQGKLMRINRTLPPAGSSSDLMEISRLVSLLKQPHIRMIVAGSRTDPDSMLYLGAGSGKSCQNMFDDRRMANEGISAQGMKQPPVGGALLAEFPIDQVTAASIADRQTVSQADLTAFAERVSSVASVVRVTASAPNIPAFSVPDLSRPIPLALKDRKSDHSFPVLSPQMFANRIGFIAHWMNPK